MVAAHITEERCQTGRFGAMAAAAKARTLQHVVAAHHSKDQIALHAAHYALDSPGAGDQTNTEVGECHHFQRIAEKESYQNQPGSGPAMRVIH